MSKEEGQELKFALLHAERLAHALRYEQISIIEEIKQMREGHPILKSMTAGMLDVAKHNARHSAKKEE